MLPHDVLGDRPTLVLLHAGIADRTMWAEHLQPLADAGYRVLAIDLPGFGEAPAAVTEEAPWDDVLETLGELAVDSAVLVGSSFGGAVAQRIAALAPERVLALALISSPAEGVEPSPQLAAAWEAEEAALQNGDIDAAVAAVVDAWTLPDAPPDLRERVARMQRGAYEQQSGEQAPAAPDPLEERPDALSEVRAPALVAVGERDMPDFRLAAETLARTLPDSELAVIAGAAHLAPLEQPAEFRALLLSFLARRVA